MQEKDHKKLPAIIIINAANVMAYSLVTCRQSVCQRVFSSLVLTVVLNLWLQGVSAQTAHPVTSERDDKQHQVNNNDSEGTDRTDRRLEDNVKCTFQVTV